jgi:hypothetical protein
MTASEMTVETGTDIVAVVTAMTRTATVAGTTTIPTMTMSAAVTAGETGTGMDRA